MTYSSKSTPRVRDGRVQRKNRTDLSPDYWVEPQEHLVIDRRRPGAGYRHVLFKGDLERFLGLLPEWDELRKGLNAILLAPGEEDCLGWHTPGIVAVCAWPRELAGAWSAGFVADRRDVLERLGVPTTKTGADYDLGWTEETVRGFQLLHILLHELGHHHDRMTTRSKVRAARGENFAETYALRFADRIWESYEREFLS